MIAEVLYANRGVVRLEDLEWPVFDPEQALTMPEYIGQLGVRMADQPRENTTTDSALHLYGRDFHQAEPRNLRHGLYFPRGKAWRRPEKLVANVSMWYCDLSPGEYPGMVPFSTGVAVSENLYEEIVMNAPYYANKIANRTERKNLADPNIEAVEDLGGESVFYALAQKHEVLEARDQELLTERAALAAVNRSVIQPEARRIVNLEPFRLLATMAIQDMVRVACRGLSYGTNQTQNTLNAVTSNIYRSPEGARWLGVYTSMAMDYNDAVRGKINQSIHGIFREMAHWREHLINNIDREYSDERSAS